MENNIYVLGPVFIPALGAIIGLMLAKNNRLQRYVSLVAALLAWASSGVVLAQNWQAAQDGELAVQLYRLGNWQPPYGIVLAVDLLGAVFGLMATTVVVGGIIYSVQSTEHSLTYPAFMPLFLIMTVGLNGAFYTGDIFTLFIFIELMVISSVVLVAISDNRLGLEAALKYLLISAIGTLFLLIGIASVYATVGTLNMADIALLLQTGETPLLARAAAVMLAASFLLKSAVFPFHFWQPDFHTTAPTPVGAMLSSVVVKVGVYGLIRLVTLLFVDQADVIGDILIVLGIIGIFFGSLSALRTYNAKRMLAYSTFGQIGFILVGIGWGNPLALMGAIIYAFNHAFIKSSLLMLTGVVSSHTKGKEGRLAHLHGAGKPLVITGILYFLGGMALSGVPPMNGFISKLALVRGGIAGSEWLSIALVVGAGTLTLLYMTRTWTLMFHRNPDSDTAELKTPGEGDGWLGPAFLIACCLLLGLYATPLVDLAATTVDQLLCAPDLCEFNPYIQAVLGN